MIQGRSHMTFLVRDLDEMELMLTTVLDARKTYNHVAFKMVPEDYDDRLQRIKSLGLEVKEGRSRGPGEGHSIYFYDNDNHLFELHSGTLNERLRRYSKGVAG